VVIRCDQCSTRFRLDEARIPERGARVRCSKCQHSFFVRREAEPGSDTPEATEESAETPVAPPARVGAEAGETAAPSGAVPTSNGGPTDEPEEPVVTPSPESATAVAGGEGRPAGRDRGDTAEGEWEFGETDVRFGQEALEPNPPDGEDPLAAAADAADVEEASASRSEKPSDELASSQTTSGEAARPEDVVAVGDSIDGGGASVDPVAPDPLDLSGDPPDALVPARPEPVSSPNEDSLAAVGDPSSWDLSSDNLEPPPAPQQPAPPAPRPVSTAAEPLFAGAAADAGDLLPALGGEEFQFLGEEGPEPAEPGRSDWVAAAVGWPLVLMLAIFTAWSALRPPPVASAPHSLPIGSGFEVTGLRSRILENLIGGSLLVVSGELRNPTGKPGALLSTLAIRLQDPSGATIEGTRALASPSLDERTVRLTDPAVLRAEQQRGARELALRELRPGETVRFDAVFDRLPARAVRFSFVEERVPLHVLGALEKTDSEGVPARTTGAGALRTPPSTTPLSGE